jgi:hypothetical protein
MDGGIGGTFTLSEDDQRQLSPNTRLAAAIDQSIRNGQRTGPVLWCWIEFTDRRSIEAFLSFMKRKAGWVAATPQEAKVFRKSKAG